MNKVELKNLVWKEGEHYISQCLNVDVSSFGKSKKEALSNLNEALALYFEDSKDIKITKIDRPEVIISRICHA